MKVINRIFQALAIICSVGALALFFGLLGEFAVMTFSGGEAKLVGAQLAFGSSVTVDGTTFDMYSSTKILFCFILTALSVVVAGFSFKKKGLRYAAPVIGAIVGVYMLVLALGQPNRWVDTQPLPDVTDVAYGSSVLYCAIALLAFTVFAAAYLLMDDYLEVKASKGSKRTIFARIAAFFKDYKSETKKIVWPGFKEVVKNTAIVLLMCLIIGALIWLFDMGIGKLFEAIRG